MRYASLRQGLVGAWCPSVSGPYGYSLPDLSGYGNHGTLTNMDPPTDWVVSGGKGALDFDGTNDVVKVASNILSGHGSGSFFMCAWVNPNSTSSYRIIAARDNDASNRHFVFGYGNSAQKIVYVGFDSGGFAIVESSAVMTAGEWQHIAVNKYGTTIDFYRNGVFVNSAPGYTKVFDVSAAQTSIGARLFPGGEQYLNGQLDDVRIFRRSMSNNEIRLLASERGIGLKPERIRNRYKKQTSFRRRRQYSQPIGVGII